MPVHQEEIYFICLDFTTQEEVSLANQYLDNHKPVCCEVDWFRNDLTITGFDSKYVAEAFEKSLLEFIDNTLM